MILILMIVIFGLSWLVIDIMEEVRELKRISYIANKEIKRLKELLEFQDKMLS